MAPCVHAVCVCVGAALPDSLACVACCSPETGASSTIAIIVLTSGHMQSLYKALECDAGLPVAGVKHLLCGEFSSLCP